MIIIVLLIGGIHMKKKLVVELSVYIILPIVLQALLGKQYGYYSIALSILIGVIYTGINKFKNNAYNLSGITILLIIVINISLDILSKTQSDLVIKKIYFLMGLSILTLVSMIFKKSIVMQLFKDILELLGYNYYNIKNLFNKNELEQYFNSFTSLLIVHLLILSFIKIHFILLNKYNAGAHSLSHSINLIFISLEIILSILNINKIKNILKYSSNLGCKNARVVYFNQYKNTKKAN